MKYQTLIPVLLSLILVSRPLVAAIRNKDWKRLKLMIIGFLIFITIFVLAYLKEL